MKRLISLALMLSTLLFGLLVPVHAVDSDFTIVNGVLTKYNGPGGDVVIPSGVTSIGKEAFSICRSLRSIVIPEGVTSIGENAFFSCQNLISVQFPSSLASIGYGAFSTCTNLPAIELPSSLRIIGGSAFFNCDALTSVTIPEGVTSMGELVFAKCDGLTSVTIAGTVKSIPKDAFLECYALSSVTIQEGVTEIAVSAFAKCESLTSIEIPEGVTAIANSAFVATGLTSVTIPSSVSSIGAGVFAFSPLLEVYYLGTEAQWNSVFISADNDVLNNALIHFAPAPQEEEPPVDEPSIPEPPVQPGDPSPLSHFELQDGAIVKYKGPGGDVVIPKSVTGIGEYAFSRSESHDAVTSVTILGDNVQIGESAFGGYYGCKNLTTVYIAGSVSSIGHSAFDGCESLTTVNISGSVSSIGEWAFYECESLTTVNITGSVSSIGDDAFRGCNNLTTVYIAGNVSSIGGYAFWQCNNLTTVYLKGDGLDIGVRAFDGCKGLTTVNISGSVSAIGSSAFSECEKLSSLSIVGERLKIGDYAFADCKALKSLKITGSISSLGGHVLDHCDALRSMTLDSSVFLASIDRNAWSYFSPDPENLTLTITGRGTIFENSNFTMRPKTVVISDGINEIGNEVFRPWNVTTIYIPRSVKYIGENAFLRTYGAPSDLTVYYAGTMGEWKSVHIEDGNNRLTGGVIHYNTDTPAFAEPSNQTVVVDGRDVQFAMYSLGGGSTNYIRVRDLAVLLNYTPAQFDVGWDKNVILTSGKMYTGSRDKAPFNSNMPYTDYTAPTIVNGKAVNLEAIQIEYNGGGYTYYKLRDLGEALGFNVGWSAVKGVYIETNKPYDPNN